MQLYPAIDMKGGKCVRLTQGLFDNVKVYSDTPADMAKLWVSQGASFLHIVDLDGALAGHSVNEDAIRAIVSSVSVPIELGGGIRSAEAVKNGSRHYPLYHRHPGSRTSGIYERTGGDVRTRPYCSWCGR